MAPRKKRRSNIDPRKLYIIRQAVLGVLLLLFIGGIVTGIWYGTRVESLTIDSVEVIGGVTIDHEKVRAAAEAELEGHYYRLVPKRFAWTYPETSIIEAVKKIDRVKEVRLERTEGTTLVVAFDEYVPHALWCPPAAVRAQAGAAPESENCLFIDQTGYAFGSAPRLSGGSFVRYVTLNEGPQVGDLAIPSATLGKTETFIELLEENFQYYVTVVELDAVGDVFYTLARGGELKATLESEPDELIENLDAIIGSEAFSHLSPGNFAYIDLRFGNKVYVNEEGVVANATSSEEAMRTESVEE